MKNQWHFFVIVLLAIGVVFRCVNIDKKIYWYDEAFTSLRISGYTQTEVLREIGNGQIVGPQDLMKYQGPTLEKKFGDTVKSLAIEEPQLPPLYFVAVKYWVQVFGDSPFSTRSFSVLMSFLVFPCLYWLCRELFAPPEVAWIAVGLVAVSPLHLLYAQEARPYSLWSAMILLCGASLLRAMRLQTKLSWGIYAIATVLGIYTHLFGLLVAIGHGIYVFAIQGFKLHKQVISYLIAMTGALLAFMPWLVILIVNRRAAVGATSWSDLETTKLSLVKNWAGNIGRVFFDVGLTSQSPPIYLIWLAIANLILLLIVGYAVYFLCCDTKQQIWLFVLAMMAVTALAVVLPDVILGGIRSTKTRYLFPTYLGIQIAVAYLLATKIGAARLPNSKPQVWKVVTVLLLTGGVLSGAVSSEAEIWWTKEWGAENTVIARSINLAAKPLVVSDISEVSLGNVLSISHLLESKVRLQLFNLNPQIPSQIELLDKSRLTGIFDDFSDVFVYGRTKAFSVKLANIQNAKIDFVAPDKSSSLWLGKLVQK